MNEKFLSRGKRKDNGEWIEGYYVPVGDKYHYICTERLTIKNNVPTFEHFYIISETAGRYTCLTDKNETRIFEGDIVKFFDIEYQKYFIGVVYYCDAAFWIDSDDENDKDDGKNLVQLGSIPKEYIEVIGNVYDNPELIGGETIET